MLNVEDLINRLTFTLAKDGAFVNFIKKDILEEAVGDVCSTGTSDVYGILLAMKLENFFPVKFLIPIINLRSRQKELLNIFVETLKEKYILGANWRYILAPIRYNEAQDDYFFFNMPKYYSDVRFIDTCRKKGIKLLDQSMLLYTPKDPILPVELKVEKEENYIMIRIIEKWFETLKRNEYYDSQNLAKDIFNSTIENDSIKTTVMAQLIFSIFETYDYFMALDIIEKLNPYCIFSKLLENPEEQRGTDFIPRRTLRNYVSYSFQQLMGFRSFPSNKMLPFYNKIQQNLKKLFNNMEINDLTPFMRKKRVFF